MSMIEEPIEESIIITKDELRASGFEALDQDDPEGWWLRCPSYIRITILYDACAVRYCFDYPHFNYHRNDYYEYGWQAVEIAQKYFQRRKQK
jgi:hypothetical protein